MHAKIIFTVDLGFGDAGKGSVVDYLTRVSAAHTVVRYNGGAQAAHRVVLADSPPREHIFSQFGSGSFAGAATHLTRFMLLDPPAMLAEAAHLRTLSVAEPFARTTIDAAALVLTPFGRAINRLRELARGAARHGSCGMGIGETVADQLRYSDQVLYAGDLRDPATVAHKLAFLHSLALAKLRTLQPALPDSPLVEQELAPLHDPHWREWLAERYAEFARQATIVDGSYLRSILNQPGSVIFEGAQGALLDEWYGFHPYTTWGTTTLANAEQLLKEAGSSVAPVRIGITRAYTTRHGAGPLPSEEAALSQALPDARNLAHPWQQQFRVGWLDLVLLRYACAIVGPLDFLALTCLDRLEDLPALQVCRAYRNGDQLIEHLPLRQPCPHNPDDEPPGALRIARTAWDLDPAHAHLTDLLMACQPVLEPLAQATALPELLSTALQLPVDLISTGPTAAEKWLHPTRLRPGS